MYLLPLLIFLTFADFNLYHFNVINHNHEYCSFLSSRSPSITIEPEGNLEDPNHAQINCLYDYKLLQLLLEGNLAVLF